MTWFFGNFGSVLSTTTTATATTTTTTTKWNGAQTSLNLASSFHALRSRIHCCRCSFQFLLFFKKKKEKKMNCNFSLASNSICRNRKSVDRNWERGAHYERLPGISFFFCFFFWNCFRCFFSFFLFFLPRVSAASRGRSATRRASEVFSLRSLSPASVGRLLLFVYLMMMIYLSIYSSVGCFFFPFSFFLLLLLLLLSHWPLSWWRHSVSRPAAVEKGTAN